MVCDWFWVYEQRACVVVGKLVGGGEAVDFVVDDDYVCVGYLVVCLCFGVDLYVDVFVMYYDWICLYWFGGR